MYVRIGRQPETPYAPLPPPSGRILTESLNSNAPKRSIFVDAGVLRARRRRIPAVRLEPAQMEVSMAKAQDAKKETKKKPEKTLKEKRLEKAAKKAAK